MHNLEGIISIHVYMFIFFLRFTNSLYMSLHCHCQLEVHTNISFLLMVLVHAEETLHAPLGLSRGKRHIPLVYILAVSVTSTESAIFKKASLSLSRRTYDPLQDSQDPER